MSNLKKVEKRREHISMGHIKLKPKAVQKREKKLRKLKSAKFKDRINSEYQKILKMEEIKKKKANPYLYSQDSENIIDKVLSHRRVKKVPQQNLEIFIGGVRQEELEGRLEFIKNPMTVSDRHLKRWKKQQTLKSYYSARKIVQKRPKHRLMALEEINLQNLQNQKNSDSNSNFNAEGKENFNKVHIKGIFLFSFQIN